MFQLQFDLCQLPKSVKIFKSRNIFSLRNVKLCSVGQRWTPVHALKIHPCRWWRKKGRQRKRGAVTTLTQQWTHRWLIGSALFCFRCNHTWLCPLLSHSWTGTITNESCHFFTALWMAVCIAELRTDTEKCFSRSWSITPLPPTPSPPPHHYYYYFWVYFSNTSLKCFKICFKQLLTEHEGPTSFPPPRPFLSTYAQETFELKYPFLIFTPRTTAG